MLNENLIVEIVRPGINGRPCPREGEVGEVVITNLDPSLPQIRLAVGDLTAVLPGRCSGAAAPASGWMGRADQNAKIKGMFVRPEQVAEFGAMSKSPSFRLAVGRANETDTMTLLPRRRRAGRLCRRGILDTAAGDRSGRGRDPATGAPAHDGKVIVVRSNLGGGGARLPGSLRNGDIIRGAFVHRAHDRGCSWNAPSSTPASADRTSRDILLGKSGRETLCACRAPDTISSRPTARHISPAKPASRCRIGLKPYFTPVEALGSPVVNTSNSYVSVSPTPTALRLIPGWFRGTTTKAICWTQNALATSSSGNPYATECPDR